MTQENKQLLFQDLCARLPYGVKIQYSNQMCNMETISDDYTVLLLGEDGYKPNIEDDLFLDIENVKPYLRPMSSMTEEEKKEFYKVVYDSMNIDNISPSVYVGEWQYSKHFDVHGLIEKGLALEAPEGMYKKEE